MEIVRRSEAEKFEDGSTFVAYEYATKDPDLNTARIELHGRYPAQGTMRNNNVKEVVYIESGQGEVIIDDVRQSVGQGDVVLFTKGERVVWDGTFVLITSCAPAWSKEQHEFLP
ncbi:MAG TPA: hypothetical protein VMU27_01625 [Candidatus Paceibacterota bacterium]|nr:hypothetical protein [Candidatus Paceibacterota bacterium]